VSAPARLALALLLVVAGCTGPPPLPAEPRVSAPGTATPPTIAAVRDALHAGLEQDPPASLVERVQALLATNGVATVEVPHEGHVHYYVLSWISGHRTLLFFERTGDGVERLRAFPG
jgi:hypothetical protein